jgi:hypothetical protein
LARLCVKISVPLLRDLVMLALGSGGMAQELFIAEAPNMVRVWVSIGLLLGPAALNSVWRMRNPLPDTPTAGGPQPSPSSSPPSG